MNSINETCPFQAIQALPGLAREPFHHQRPPCPKGDGNGARDQGFAARSGFGPQADLQTSDITGDSGD